MVHLFLVLPEEDSLDRELQSKELARIMAASYPRPVVFLGYVVSKPLAPRRMYLLLICLRPELKGNKAAPYDILVNDGLVYDIDPQDLDRWYVDLLLTCDRQLRRLS